MAASSQALPHGDRVFYQLPADEPMKNSGFQKNQVNSVAELLKYIDGNVIGRDAVFSGPWGLRSNVYCDYTASARSLHCIEDYIKQQVLPVYGNTHTTTTVTSLQTTLYRHEARDIVRNAVNASEHDAVVFVGSGCTGAIHKLINGINFKNAPVVLFGPHEHHSNLLPWREIGAQMVSIPEDDSGLVDIDALESELKRCQPSGRQMIGCFSAASNITGILTDTVAITTCLHRYGALAFWDYATAGPYVDIDMNPVVAKCADQSLASKDAIYLSPHKFVGGVETPGILVAKKKLFDNPVPYGGGGGSVFFVTKEDHRYLQQIEMREEGGTPSIVGAIRAGMTFQLKQAVGTSNIMDREHQLCRKAVEFWSSSSPNLILLGNTTLPRLPIFSFLIRHPATKQFLHYNFVCAVLNDVFGIQTRGGCACAGPYAQHLLGMDLALAKRFESMLLEDDRLDRVHLRRYHEYSEREILRPGFTRLNLPYFMSDECVDFVLSAVAMVAEHGWKLLPQYIFNPETGEWKQRHHKVFQDRRWLGSISYTSGKMHYPDPPTVKSKGKFPEDCAECLSLAEGIFQKATKMRLELADQSVLFDGEAGQLRWFMLPSEAFVLLSNKDSSWNAVKEKKPLFEPPTFEKLSQHVGNGCKSTSEDDISRGNCEWLVDVQSSQHKVSAGSSQQKSRKQDQQWTNTDYFQASIEHGFVGNQTLVCNSVQLDNNTVDCAIPNTETSDIKGLNCLNDNIKVISANGGSGQDNCAIVETTGTIVEQVTYLNDDASHVLSMGDVITSTKSEKYTLGQFHSAHESRLTANAQSDCISDDKAHISVSSSIIDTKKTNGFDRTMSETNTGDVETKDTEMAIINQTSKSKDHSKRSKDNDQKSQDSNSQISSVDTIGDSMSKLTMTAPSSKPECLPCMQPTRFNYKSQESSRLVPDVIGNSLDVTGADAAVRFHAPPKKIFKPTLQALEEYHMLVDGDRVLVCLSGGKDSLSLLHTLKQYQFVAKKKGINFDLGAVTVDPQTSSFDPSPLKGYLRSLGLPYFYEEQCIIDQAASLPEGCDSICSFCSRMKRGRLYACARREGYNVLAMGQHLDDLTESFLMSVFHNGLLRTMKANYRVKEGDLRVIRPFVYVREKHLREFAEQCKLPVIAENCPACFEAPKERHRTKQLLAGQELLFPNLYSSMQTALKPLMAKNKTGLESSRRNDSTGDVDGDEEDI